VFEVLLQVTLVVAEVLEPVDAQAVAVANLVNVSNQNSMQR
jgi:hypothetical protein